MIQASRLAALALVAVSLLGCGVLPPDYTLHVSNATTLPLALVVNGKKVSDLEPGTEANFSPGHLPSLPWSVSTQTSTGRVVATMQVEPGSVVDDRAIDGTGSYSAPAGGVSLSCGQVKMWVGGTQPIGGGPAEGKPGDCER
jgi:hypothetical protein